MSRRFAILTYLVIATAVAHGETPTRITVKFTDAAEVRLRAAGLTSLAGADLAAFRDTLDAYGASKPERLFARPEGAIARTLQLAETRSGRDLPDLNGYYELTVADDDADRFVRALRRLDVVANAYRSPQASPPPVVRGGSTPDFEASQGYLDPAPGGIDARHAWTHPGGRGAGVKIVDIEYAWTITHEDLSAIAGGVDCFGQSLAFSEHGTAVIGELAGDPNGIGVTGIVTDAEIGLVSNQPEGMTYSVARAIDCAIPLLDAGDVLLLESQTAGPQGFLPSEWDAAEFDSTLVATSLGIVVVAAAGNGNVDLDDPLYGSRFDVEVRDSGAIIVGAGAAPNSGQPDRSRLDFSTHGSRVDVQGWGHHVVTSGYGDLFDAGPDRRYTEEFGGTSSASPIVTGAVVALQGIQLARGGSPLEPRVMRQLLIDTGTPQQDGPFPGEIGPRPNLVPAIDALPDLYVVDRSVADDPPLGNGDGIADPGETIELPQTVKNFGPIGETGIAGHLGAASPALAITRSLADWDDLAPGASAPPLGDPHRLTIAPGVSCGERFPYATTLTSDDGLDVSNATLPIGRARIDEVPSTDVPQTIPFRVPPPVVSTLTVPDDRTIDSVQVAVDISHGDVGELLITLESPAATVVTLHAQSNPGGIDLVTVYDTGTLSDGPGSMADFIGESSQGTWTLTIEDRGATAVPPGTLNAWSLEILSSGCTPLACAEPVPPPVGDSLRIDLVDPATLAFDWDAVGGAAGYRIWSASEPTFAAREIVGASVTNALSAPLVEGAVVYFDARAVNVCEWEGP